MVTQSRHMTIADLKLLLAALDSDVVLLAQRTDGFGERMRAVLTGMALADALGVAFALRWEGLDRPFGQSSPDAEEVFAPQFLDRHLVTKSEIAQGALLRLREVSKVSPEQLRTKVGAAQTLYIEVPQTPTTGGLDPGRPEEWSQMIADSASRIEYAPAISAAQTAAHGTADSLAGAQAPVAIHLRAGDIIYGNHRMLDRFHFKCCPYPIAQHILLHEKSRGAPVVLFGQDAELIAHLKTTWQAVTAAELAEPFAYNPLQQIVFEITLMSRCRTIYAGRSGFAILASLIGQVPQVNVADFARKNDLGAYLATEVMSPQASHVPPLQVSFAARWAMLLMDEAFPQTDTAVALLKICRQFDPENIRHALFSACYAQSQMTDAGVADEMEALLDNEHFRIGDVVRHLMPIKHRNPPLPPQCTSVFAKLAETGDRRGIFAHALIAADTGRIEEARQMSEDLFARRSDYLSRTLKRQIEALKK